MIALALTGGSLPFALFYSGLQLTTPATGALVNHFQFVLVALFAVAFLKERIRPTMWAGFAVLCAWAVAALALAVAVYLARVARGSARVARLPLDGPLLAFSVWSLLSAAFAPDPLAAHRSIKPVSYTPLTLPTIYPV